VDKMSSDFRGDPASALLEVLDPEQNCAFNDHYLDVDYDLSRVMFITTANTLPGIPLPLQDRMEIIRIPGYTDYEKLHIARRFLLPKQMRENGLEDIQLRFSDSAFRRLMDEYTREAGVRNLEREIAGICRKIARKVLKEGREIKISVTGSNVPRFLGVPRFRRGELEDQDRVGLTNGLAWTEFGGELLQTEVTVMPGKGKLIITGKLGEVMQESAQAAMSYVRSRARRFGIPEDFYQTHDIHIHVPEGATPKDGPSAGITMATSLVSALTGIPVRRDVAMTGEITLRGRVLPIGGLKEKTIAAYRAKVRTVIIPEDNEKDLKEIPALIKNALEFVPVSHMDQVLELALVHEAGKKLFCGDGTEATEAKAPHQQVEEEQQVEKEPPPVA